VRDRSENITQKSEKIVPLEVNVMPEAEEALQQKKELPASGRRQASMKERERERQEKLKQRERVLKERAQRREAALKQRERERDQKIRNRK
jgi:hypothetical protein